MPQAVKFQRHTPTDGKPFSNYVSLSEDSRGDSAGNSSRPFGCHKGRSSIIFMRALTPPSPTFFVFEVGAWSRWWQLGIPEPSDPHQLDPASHVCPLFFHERFHALPKPPPPRLKTPETPLCGCWRGAGAGASGSGLQGLGPEGGFWFAWTLKYHCNRFTRY